MTAKNHMTEIASVDDLMGHNISVYAEDSMIKIDIFKHRYPEIYNDIFSNDLVWRNESDMLNIINERQAVFGLQSEIENVKRANCNLQLRTIDILGTFSAGLAVRKNLTLLPNISLSILEHLMDGVIVNITEKHTRKKCPTRGGMSNPPRADLEKMKGLLIITASLAAFSAIVIIIERLSEVCKSIMMKLIGMVANIKEQCKIR